MKKQSKLISIILCAAIIAGLFGSTGALASDQTTPDLSPDIQLTEPTDSNAMVWYNLDDPAGTTVIDSALPTPRMSLALSGTFVPDGGKVGGAMRFNGSSDYIKINNDDVGETGFLHGRYTAESVSLWIKPDTLSGKQMIYKQGGDIGGVAIRINDGYLEASVATGAPNLLERVALDESRIGQWSHILLAFDNGTARLYLDGSLVRERATSANAIPAARRGAAIGRNLYPANAFGETAVGDEQWFCGMIDEVIVYNIAVTPKIIVQGYDEIAPIVVSVGTDESELTLPDTVNVRLSADNTVQIDVSEWTAIDAYNANTADVYAYMAEVGLPANLANPNYRFPIAYAVVRDAATPANTDLMIAKYQVNKALDGLAISNDTTANDIMAAATAAITGGQVSAEIDEDITVVEATAENDGRLYGTIILSISGEQLEADFDLNILKLGEIGNNIFLQSAEKKNRYIYVNGETAALGYMVSEESRAFTLVSGVNGDGVSFKYGDGAYLAADGNDLVLSPALTAGQKRNATFLEEAPLGAEPGWADVYAGEFCSYRLDGTDLYITCTDDGVVLAPAAADENLKLAATFKKTGKQTEMPVSNMRGSVYYPSYAYNAYQFWKYYDSEIIERDMVYAANLGINAYRIWVSYEYWLEDSVHFEKAYNDFLRIAAEHDIIIMTSLFDGCGEAFTEQTKARYYADSYCITSPSAEIFNNPARYNEPLEFVTWFMTRYKDDTRHFAIEIYNEPWGVNRSALALYLCAEAVKQQGCVRLSGGTAPDVNFSIPMTVEVGMDLIQYHDNFPGTTAAFKSNANSRIKQGQNANMPVFCTEVQWVAGPTKFSSYETLAPTCEEIMAESEWAPFYWTLMVHPGYLKEIRNKVDMTNGILQEDGNPWTVAAAQAIAPEKDFTGFTDNQQSAFTQYYYSHTFSDDFLDLKGNKWETVNGSWSAQTGAYVSAGDYSKALASLTKFEDVGVKFTLKPNGGNAGIILRADEVGGYFGGIHGGKLFIGEVVQNRAMVLASAEIAAADSYDLEFYAEGGTLTLCCGDVVLTAENDKYTSGAIGLLATSAGAEIDDISASVNLKFDEKPVPPPEVLLGDLTGDGSINVSDVVALRLAIMDGSDDPDEVAAGDMNSDGALTVVDVVALRMLIINQ